MINIDSAFCLILENTSFRSPIFAGPPSLRYGGLTSFAHLLRSGYPAQPANHSLLGAAAPKPPLVGGQECFFYYIAPIVPSWGRLFSLLAPWRICLFLPVKQVWSVALPFTPFSSYLLILWEWKSFSFHFWLSIIVYLLFFIFHLGCLTFTSVFFLWTEVSIWE